MSGLTSVDLATRLWRVTGWLQSPVLGLVCGTWWFSPQKNICELNGAKIYNYVFSKQRIMYGSIYPPPLPTPPPKPVAFHRSHGQPILNQCGGW